MKETLPSYYFHYQKSGHIEAIKIHTKHKHFIRTDIKSFFPSISKNRIIRVLKKNFSYSFKDAARIAEGSTVSTGEGKTSLPYGFPQSPLLATLALYKSYLGKYLDELNKKKDILVSVYMDDIIISWDNDSLKVKDIKIKLLNASIKSKLFLNKEKNQTSCDKKPLNAFNILINKYNQLEISSKRIEKFKNQFSNGSEISKKAIIKYINLINEQQSLEIKNESSTLQNI